MRPVDEEILAMYRTDVVNPRDCAPSCYLRNIVDKNYGMNVSVVVLHHALTKSFLAGSVPKLQLCGKNGIRLNHIKMSSNYKM